MRSVAILLLLVHALAAQDCRTPVNSSCAAYGVGPTGGPVLKPPCCLPAAASTTTTCVPFIIDNVDCSFDLWGSYSEPRCCNATTITGASLLPSSVSTLATSSVTTPVLNGTQLVIPSSLWSLLAQQQILLEYAQTQGTGYESWRLGTHPCW